MSSAKKKSPGRKLCEPIEIAGQRYDVVARKEIDDEGTEGMCHHTENLIEVAEQAEDRMADTLLHEVMHAALEASGHRHVIRTKHRLTREEWHALEEDVIRALAPTLLSTLRRVGWLRLPKLSRRGILRTR